MRKLGQGGVRDGASVALPPPTQVVTPVTPVLRVLRALPEECACCAAPATHCVALSPRHGISLLVGYCEACVVHQSSRSSRGLGLGLASLLLGFSSAAALPLLTPRLGLLGLVLAVTLIVTLPLLALLLPLSRVHAPHTASGPAVAWAEGPELLCASPRYAERVAELYRAQLSPKKLRDARASPWLCALPVFGIGAACLSFYVYHPLLRIINLGSARVEVALDGQRLSFVDPTSNESPAAGALLRVPAGEHTLSVASSVDGATLARVQAKFESGAVHLFAIAGDDTCFWLETTGYGRERRARPSFEPLRGEQHFWVLPAGIDTWFAPNPGVSDENSHSSGGLLTALRQAPCVDAPSELRTAP